MTGWSSAKVKERLGGRVKLIVSGGAPLAGKALHPAHPVVSPYTGARRHVPRVAKRGIVHDEYSW